MILLLVLLAIIAILITAYVSIGRSIRRSKLAIMQGDEELRELRKQAARSRDQES